MANDKIFVALKARPYYVKYKSTDVIPDGKKIGDVIEPKVVAGIMYAGDVTVDGKNYFAMGFGIKDATYEYEGEKYFGMNVTLAPKG